MQIRLKSLGEVRHFAVVITLIAVVGNLAMQYVIYPREVLISLWFPSTIIAISLAMPISYFVGLKMLDIHKLTLQLEHAVNHDALTETCSRMRFYEQVGQLGPWPMMLIAVDIDHFKSINDRFGHQAGDAALKQFATTLVRNCREDDIVARFGGEEFVILLRAETPEEALATAERLRMCVGSRTFVLNGETVGLTASFGVAPVISAERVDEALHQADLALYRSKRSGRDMVSVYDAVADKVATPPGHGKLGRQAGAGDAARYPPSDAAAAASR